MSPVKFTSAGALEEVIWAMKMADYPRSTNRALIDNLFNGLPPFTAEEQVQNRISSNVNFLDATRIAQDARSQFSNALQKPGNYFTVKLDSGPIHKRDAWSQIITAEINKRMKRSSRYTETLNNVFGQLVLHGIGPVSWCDKQTWCPDMHGMADVLVPSRTLLTMENLSYFALYRRYTAAELWRKTHGPRVDKGWNMPVVERALKWTATQYGQSIGSSDYLYNVERWAEDIKENTGLYASDQMPTINCWDAYFLDDSKKEWGWKRRIVLDCPSPSETSRGRLVASNKSIIDSRNEFLYNPGDRNYASKLSEILHFQFADGSVVAPFRYHSVRSLGFLLYSVCHLQNRLRCKLNDATFEALLNYFRVNNPEDNERLQKVDLMNLGIIPEGLSFVSPQERWQVNQNLVQNTMLMNRQSMAENSTSYTKDFGYEGRRTPEKTATEVSAEVAAATAMVGSMLQKAYGYQEHQDREIARRFCIKNSKDADVRAFRAGCLKAGVPEEMFHVEQWDIAHERVIGSGNKQAELAQLNLLMQVINRYDPDAQRIILRRYTMASVDDPKLAAELVPTERNLTTNSVHDAQLSAATMLLGLQMGLKEGGVNHGEYSAALLGAMKNTIDKIAATGGVGTPDDIAGLQNLAGQSIDGQPIEGNGVANHIAILAQDDGNKQEVKQLSDVLGRLMNEVKAFAQRLAESQQQSQEGNGEMPADEVVKLKSLLVQAEAKAETMKAAAAQKLQHKQQAFDQRLQQSQAKSELQNADSIRKVQVSESAKDLETAASIQRESRKPDVVPA